AQHADLELVGAIEREVGMVGPEITERGDFSAAEESPGLRIDHAGRVAATGRRLAEDSLVPDPVSKSLPLLRSLGPADENGQPGGGSKSRHHAGVGIEERTEDLIAHAGRADEIE